jgi:hypothetical protein
VNKLIGILASAVVSMSVTALAATPEIVDEATGVHFASTQTVEEHGFTCLGAGARKVFFFKAYAITFCLDTAAVPPTVTRYTQTVLPSKPVEDRADALIHDEKFFDALASAPADKLVVMHMMRDVAQEKFASAFRKSLENVLPAAKIEKLIAAIPRDAKKDETVRLYTSDQKTLTIAIEEQRRVIDDPEIAAKLWRVWLGPDSVTPGLKESIARRALAAEAL